MTGQTRKGRPKAARPCRYSFFIVSSPAFLAVFLDFFIGFLLIVSLDIVSPLAAGAAPALSWAKAVDETRAVDERKARAAVATISLRMRSASVGFSYRRTITEPSRFRFHPTDQLFVRS